MGEGVGEGVGGVGDGVGACFLEAQVMYSVYAVDHPLDQENEHRSR